MKRTFLFILVCILLLSGCSENAMKVTLDDMTVELSSQTVSAGEVTFDVVNIGSVNHMFVVIRTDLRPDELPYDPDKISQVLEYGLVGKIEDIAPGTSASISLDLEPGHYVVLCNKIGHHAARMYSEFMVK